MHPNRRKPLHHRMIGCTHRHLEGVLRSVARVSVVRQIDLVCNVCLARPWIDLDRLSDERRSPAKSYHFIEFGPIPERVVRSVNEHHATSRTDKLDERVAYPDRPFVPVVIQHYHIGRRKVGCPLVPPGCEVCLRLGLRLLKVFPCLGQGGLILGALGLSWDVWKSQLGRRRRCDLKSPGSLQRGAQMIGRRTPVMVVASVDDESADRLGSVDANQAT